MSLSQSIFARFSLGLAAGFVVTALSLGAGGCGETNPLDRSCKRQATCAEENDWQFSEAQCAQEAEFLFEKAKSALCGEALEAYADCVDGLGLACDDVEATVAAKKCKSESEDLSECMADAAKDEADEKAGSSGKPAGSSSGGSSSGGSSSSGGTGVGGLDAYCDTVSECAGGNMSAETCASQQDAIKDAAEQIGCDDELDAMFGCAAKLSCSELPQYTTKCKAQYDAYTKCGTGN